jgi:hypothetical protein
MRSESFAPCRERAVVSDRRSLPAAARIAPGKRPANARKRPPPRPRLRGNARERDDIEHGVGEPDQARAHINDDRSIPENPCNRRISRGYLLIRSCGT